MVEQIVFVLMIAVALFIVSSRNLKRVIVSLGVLSLLASFCYLLYHAPDVAVAEAVIGSALSTILYIIAFKKHRTFYIFITQPSQQKKSDFKLRSDMKSTIETIMQYCTKHELEAQCVYTWEKPLNIVKDHTCDLILEYESEKITVYGLKTEKHAQKLRGILCGANSVKQVEFVEL